MANPVVQKYSELAAEYDDPRNSKSCWGQAAMFALDRLLPVPATGLVVDVGCGTGHAVAELAAGSPRARFLGVEPAEGMRLRAASLAEGQDNVTIVDGRFESLPMDAASVDYLFSVFAFHWTTDVEQSAAELSRVLSPRGSMDLFFVGRRNGWEFIQATSSIFLRYLGAKGLLDAAKMRQQLTREQAEALFVAHMGEWKVTVEETERTYYDTLDGHWGWWVRIEGQFVQLPPDRREECDREVFDALSALETERGIPYTVHELHVRVEPRP